MKDAARAAGHHILSRLIYGPGQLAPCAYQVLPSANAINGEMNLNLNPNTWKWLALRPHN
jgi:hypothetical protein